MSGAKATSSCNTLCSKCLRPCKQTRGITLVDCPRYRPLPFRIDKPRYEQLGLFPEDGQPG